MALYDFVCDSCGGEQKDVILPYVHEPAKCPNCGLNMRQRFQSVSVRGFFHWMGDVGKNDRLVCYPDGHCRTKTYNELYRDGGL